MTDTATQPKRRGRPVGWRKDGALTERRETRLSVEQAAVYDAIGPARVRELLEAEAKRLARRERSGG